jgi:pimeloyl-ACP methyl ester carboxylesterase
MSASAALVSAPAPRFRAPPGLGLLGWEALSGLQVARLALAAPSLRRAPRGGATVLALPGFAAEDASTLPLRGFLSRLGHDVEGWGLGRNRGDVPALVPRVTELVLARAKASGQVHLVGQSLGGVLAREVARDHAGAVAQVITLGTPVVGGPAHTRVGLAYGPERTAQIQAGVDERNRVEIGVPITAIYSRRDGIVNWRACIDDVNPRANNVEVGSSHLGMGIDPDVWLLVARLLADRD